MAGDETVLLRDVCVKIGSGATPRGGKEAYKGGATSLIRSQNIYNEGFHRDGLVYIDDDQSAELRNVEVQANDVLLNITGDSVARCCQVTADVLPARVNQHVAILRPEPKSLHARFLRYVLVSHEYQSRLLALASAGATRPALTKLMIEQLDIPKPPLAEQKAIAAVLGTLDDKIELNRRMNATLEAMARALFQSWFVDFDPVRAKLDGRKPIGLDEPTAALFPSTFDETAVGHIPHAWRVGSIYEISNVIYGAPFASSLFNAEKLGKPLIRIRDLPNESPAVFTTEVHTKGYLLQPGDIAVGMDGEFRAYLWAGVESWLNQRCCVFAPKPGFSAAFVRNSIIAPLAQVEATETATTVIHLGKNDIDRFTVIIPDAPVAEAFKRQCQPWYDQIVANKQQSRTLATLRDTLLPKLLSGELSVAETH